MGILSKWLEKKHPSDEEDIERTTEVDCPHTFLTARWDNLDDMGDDAKASVLICESCGEAFRPGDPRLERRLSGFS